MNRRTILQQDLFRDSLFSVTRAVLHPSGFLLFAICDYCHLECDAQLGL